jgi:hypothetical protein
LYALPKMLELWRTNFCILGCLCVLGGCGDDGDDGAPQRDAETRPSRDAAVSDAAVRDAAVRDAAVRDAAGMDASQDASLLEMCRAADGDGGEASGRDGCYECEGNGPPGGSCSGPFFSGAPRWTLGVMGARVTVYIGGGIGVPFGCEGTWSDGVLECPTSYSRSGRYCQVNLIVREEPDGSLTFWFARRELDASDEAPPAPTPATATCRK